jgi:hypothetical protein
LSDAYGIGIEKLSEAELAKKTGRAKGFSRILWPFGIK